MVPLHALGEDAGTWDAVAAEFAKTFRVFAVDLRGHGSSDRPGTYTFELTRDDVLAVLDHLGLRRVTLLGHSMGGTVAYPDRRAGAGPDRPADPRGRPAASPRSRAVPERQWTTS
ncbi:MAG TPA: alpha/beta fold hydrolase [Micromonosporaceae bacterium]